VERARILTKTLGAQDHRRVPIGIQDSRTGIDRAFMRNGFAIHPTARKFCTL